MENVARSFVKRRRSIHHDRGTARRGGNGSRRLAATKKFLASGGKRTIVNTDTTEWSEAHDRTKNISPRPHRYREIQAVDLKKVKCDEPGLRTIIRHNEPTPEDIA